MRLRRAAFLRDRNVFRALQPGHLVRVNVVSSSWEPYEYPIKRTLVMRCRNDAKLTRTVAGICREIEVETTIGERRYATLLLRDEDDAKRLADGRVDHSVTGSPNTVLLIWRHGKKPGGWHTTGSWSHLAHFERQLSGKKPCLAVRCRPTMAPRSKRFETVLSTIQDAVADAASETQALAEELGEWRDNIEERFGTTAKYEAVDAAAYELEDIAGELGLWASSDDILDHVRWRKVRFDRDNKPRPSRRLRAENVAAALDSVVDELKVILEELAEYVDEYNKDGAPVLLDAREPLSPSQHRVLKKIADGDKLTPKELSTAAWLQQRNLVGLRGPNSLKSQKKKTAAPEFYAYREYRVTVRSDTVATAAYRVIARDDLEAIKLIQARRASFQDATPSDAYIIEGWHDRKYDPTFIVGETENFRDHLQDQLGALASVDFPGMYG